MKRHLIFFFLSLALTSCATRYSKIRFQKVDKTEVEERPLYYSQHDTSLKTLSNARVVQKAIKGVVKTGEKVISAPIVEEEMSKLQPKTSDLKSLTWQEKKPASVPFINNQVELFEEVPEEDQAPYVHNFGARFFGTIGIFFTVVFAALILITPLVLLSFGTSYFILSIVGVLLILLVIAATVVVFCLVIQFLFQRENSAESKLKNYLIRIKNYIWR